MQTMTVRELLEQIDNCKKYQNLDDNASVYIEVWSELDYEGFCLCLKAKTVVEGKRELRIETGLHLKERPSTKNLTFSKALKALLEGHRITRTIWDIHDMYLWYVPREKVKTEHIRDPFLRILSEENSGEIEYRSIIRMMTADKTILSGWVPDQDDLISSDWRIL